MVVKYWFLQFNPIYGIKDLTFKLATGFNP